MKVTIPSHLSDAELDAAVRSLAGKERRTTGELVAHLAELDGRPGVYAGQGYGSLFTDVLVAELAPRPDVPSLVRRLPTLPSPPPATETANSSPARSAEPTAGAGPSATAFVPAPRPVVQPTAPQRYRVQFTIGQPTHDRRRRLHALLRREIPDGDPGAIFDRARAVKRAVWPRDGGRCACVAPDGRRCTETTFIEFHHLKAYAHQGRRQSPTSSCAVGGTTSTKRSCCSGPLAGR
jgi:hypothetical protein